MSRIDKRSIDELRPVDFTIGYVDYPEGSALITCGNTRVLCNVSLEKGVPPWMNPEDGGGWVTAEYAMLPRATHTRNRRETKGPKGRTQEISRLIGRSLRAGVNMDLLNGHTLTVDCDVLQADGGTRTASITGAYLALRVALEDLIKDGTLDAKVLLPPVAAISVGIVDGNGHLDLCYEEDVRAEVDMNIVMNADGKFIEVQGTAEGQAFSQAQLDTLLQLGAKGVNELIELQNQAFTRSSS